MTMKIKQSTEQAFNSMYSAYALLCSSVTATFSLSFSFVYYFDSQ